MENNLNYKGIDTYCDQLSKKVVGEAFEGKQFISGQEILSITPIKQVNLFIIKNLFSEWQEEANKVKSPYFNYEDEAVQKALTNFMNVLSKNIAVDKLHLLPLLRTAIKEAILLIFSPYDFYTHQIAENDQLNLEELKSLSKYVKVNENIFKSLLEKLEAEKVMKVDRDKMIKSLNTVFESTDASPEDVNSYLTDFSTLLPLDQLTIYGVAQEEETETKTEGGDEQPESESPDDPNKAQPINEQFENNQKVLNDELGKEPKTSLADIHQKQKINDIEKHLSINQRFMFVRALFDNDEDAFKKTVGHLESLENREIAFQYLSDNHPNWDYESEEVEEFMEIIAKRLGE